jgi:hypothetical protein
MEDNNMTPEIGQRFNAWLQIKFKEKKEII